MDLKTEHLNNEETIEGKRYNYITANDISDKGFGCVYCLLFAETTPCGKEFTTFKDSPEKEIQENFVKFNSCHIKAKSFYAKRLELLIDNSKKKAILNLLEINKFKSLQYLKNKK
jgi:hypothetical protein